MGNHEQFEAPKAAESKHESAHLAAALMERHDPAMSAKDSAVKTDNLVAQGVLPSFELSAAPTGQEISRKDVEKMGVKTDKSTDDGRTVTKYEYPNGMQIATVESGNPKEPHKAMIVIDKEGTHEKKDGKDTDIVDKQGNVLAKKHEDGSITVKVSDTEYVTQDRSGSIRKESVIRNGKNWDIIDTNNPLGNDMRPSERMGGRSH